MLWRKRKDATFPNIGPWIHWLQRLISLHCRWFKLGVPNHRMTEKSKLWKNLKASDTRLLSLQMSCWGDMSVGVACLGPFPPSVLKPGLFSLQ